MKIHEVAKLTGITVRTLHYYDEIGLLCPNKTPDSGYRIYDDNALETLQQILFFRELDFPLKEIKEIMENPGYDKAEVLRNHRELLRKKKERLEGLIDLVDTIIKGDKVMGLKEFDISEIEEHKKKYADEVKKRWGTTKAYEESEQKTASYNEEQWKVMGGEMEEIFKAFGENRDLEPDSAKIQALVKTWQDYISEHFYTCSNEMLLGLGQMYVGDDRFTQNIEQYGTGTAQFMADAIAVYCAEK